VVELNGPEPIEALDGFRIESILYKSFLKCPKVVRLGLGRHLRADAKKGDEQRQQDFPQAYGIYGNGRSRGENHCLPSYS
jgi:hypothetical protein